MIVTDIIDISKKQCKIYIDHEFAFVLYKGELHLYEISLNHEIAEDTYFKIIEELLTKRCKLRALNLLKERSYTEFKLKEKLIRGQYPQTCIDSAIEYVKSYGYIDDLEYAKNYLFYHGTNMNKQQILTKLRQRGVSKELILLAYSEYENDFGVVSDEELIHVILQKKGFSKETECDEKFRNKMIRMLMQKGFSYDVIISSLRSYLVNE